MPLCGKASVSEEEFLYAAATYGSAVYAYNAWWWFYPARSEEATRLRMNRFYAKKNLLYVLACIKIAAVREVQERNQ